LQRIIATFAVVTGVDDHEYVNLMFATERPKNSWRRIVGQELYQNAHFGELLRAAWMAMCEGPHAWDYLLLHHFDAGVALDTLL
jgi:hypothetical protein